MCELVDRGRGYERGACVGECLAESRLITFEDPADMVRLLSPAKLTLLRAVKARPGSIGALASRLRRDRSAVTREVAELKRFGLGRVAEEVLPGHGPLKKESAVAGEVRPEG